MMAEHDLSNQAQPLADLVAFQPDSVISRTLLKAPNGTITLFAFDGHQSLSEHTTPHDALVQVLDGEFEITVDGEPKAVAQGQVLLLPADVPHALVANLPSKMLLTMIRG
jgi:quercetin dioxygenase-like cupin family protein